MCGDDLAWIPDDRLRALLRAWCDDIDSEPPPETWSPPVCDPPAPGGDQPT